VNLWLRIYYIYYKPSLLFKNRLFWKDAKKKRFESRRNISWDHITQSQTLILLTHDWRHHAIHSYLSMTEIFFSQCFAKLSLHISQYKFIWLLRNCPVFFCNSFVLFSLPKSNWFINYCLPISPLEHQLPLKRTLSLKSNA
jgi:hypothetical protein